MTGILSLFPNSAVFLVIQNTCSKVGIATTSNNRPHPQLTEIDFLNLVGDLDSQTYGIRTVAFGRFQELIRTCPIDDLDRFIQRLLNARNDIPLESRRRIENLLNPVTFTEYLRRGNYNNNEMNRGIRTLLRLDSLRVQHISGATNSDFMNRLPRVDCLFLTQHSNEENLISLMRYSNIRDEMLEILSTNKNINVRLGVARHEGIRNNSEIMQSLARDRNVAVRREIARHGGYLPRSVYETLRMDSDPQVRMLVGTYELYDY